MAEVDLNPNIWNAALDEDRLTLLGDIEPLITDVSWESRPSASWDGTRLAFRSNRDGGFDMWLKNLQTGQ
jgi:Tol biopolymer transport system component